MKRILLFIGLLWSVMSSAQISGFTKLNNYYEWIGGVGDSTIGLPYGATARLAGKSPARPGLLWFQTSDSSIYYYTGTQWLKVAGAAGIGTVTSVATNTATGITGGTITTTGTLSIDTVLISTRLWRQKGIDSIVSLIPDVSGFATQSALDDTAAAIRGDFPDISGLVTQSALDDSTAAVRGDFPSGDNFANADLTLTGNRVHDANGYDLTIDSVGSFYQTTTVGAAGLYDYVWKGYNGSGHYFGNPSQTDYGSLFFEYSNGRVKTQLESQSAAGMSIRTDTVYISSKLDFSEASNALSQLKVSTGKISIDPNQGNLFIDTLTNASASYILNYNPTTGLVSYAAAGVSSSDLTTTLADYVLRTELSDSTAAIRADFPAATDSIPINHLMGATGTDSIQNLAYNQYWQWSGLTTQPGLEITASNSVTSGSLVSIKNVNSLDASDSTQSALYVLNDGENNNANEMTYGIKVENTHIGTGSINVGGLFSASGAASNYALQLKDGSEGAGKFLTSDATGRTTWGNTTANDIEITDYTKGIILRTSDATRARITLTKDGGGNLQLTITGL